MIFHLQISRRASWQRQTQSRFSSVAAAGLPDARGCRLQTPFPLGIPGWSHMVTAPMIHVAFPSPRPRKHRQHQAGILPILFLDFFCVFFFYFWTMLVTCPCWEAPWCVNQKYTNPTWPSARAPQSLSCHRADSVDPPPAFGPLAKPSPITTNTVALKGLAWFRRLS